MLYEWELNDLADFPKDHKRLYTKTYIEWKTKKCENLSDGSIIQCANELKEKGKGFLVKYMIKDTKEGSKDNIKISARHIRGVN